MKRTNGLVEEVIEAMFYPNPSRFDQAIKELDLTYAQVELIKQAVEEHVICRDVETSHLMNESLGAATIMNRVKEAMRERLRKA